ncbi:stalk domain-containing protein [Paenibacillus sp. J2TS4]|uniref:stalk domain-containing protein n=1 Tax=Paenibacillus sp. J2TS4 TaxID=2807194 RepID=UPI001B26498A|nr:stalk domain-containing protein [Paenibacillus sp. J2TS4]GIP33391.1 hypothetical protein J2TS4_26010 [Paenibacillus sp. J2TS4]
MLFKITLLLASLGLGFAVMPEASSAEEEPLQSTIIEDYGTMIPSDKIEVTPIDQFKWADPEYYSKPFLSKELRKWAESAKDEESIEAAMIVREAKASEFEQKFREAFGDTSELVQVHPIRFHTRLTKEMMDQLLTWEEMILISPVDFEVPLYNPNDYGAIRPPGMYVDGKQVEFERFPLLENGTTYVPLKQAGESMGATVTWEASTHEIDITKGESVIRYSIDEDLAIRNGQPMDFPVEIRDGVSYIPVRKLGDALGCLAGWEDKAHKVVGSCAPKTKVKVKDVIDGITLLVDWNGEEQKLRLAGVDVGTMERSYGNIAIQKAYQYTKEHLDDQEVWVQWVESKEEPLDIPRGFVFLEDGKFFDASMISSGYASSGCCSSAWSPFLNELSWQAIDRKIGVNGEKLLDGVHSMYHPVGISRIDADGAVIISNFPEMDEKDLSGWILVSSKGGEVFQFPEGTVIGSASRIIIMTGESAVRGIRESSGTVFSDRYFIWTTESIWDGVDDEVILYDEVGYEIDRYKVEWQK